MKNERRSKVVAGLLLGLGALFFSSCCCCIIWFRTNEMEQEQQDSVGSATRILALRDQLDRIHDSFPAQPVHVACTETTPEGRVAVLHGWPPLCGT